MKSYLDIVKHVFEHGTLEKNRTGHDALVVTGAMFEHDMSIGFPLLTTKRVPFKLVASELEFFIRGFTDKSWLQEEKNHIWDEWASPKKAPYGTTDEHRAVMLSENDLGPIYGWQWRHIGAKYTEPGHISGSTGIDQLKILIEEIKRNPTSRRLIVTAWNPLDLDKMALPPCHYSFQVTVAQNKLNLLWSQRSVDVALGLPFNIASYGLLLHLLAKECGYEEGRLIGFLANTHIYQNHINGLTEQLTREPKQLPSLQDEQWSSIFDWQYTDTTVVDYYPHPKIAFDIAI